MSTKLIPVSEARTRLTDLVHEADDEEVTLLKHGRPVAVLLSHAGYERLLDHIEDLEDENSVLRARSEPDSIPFNQALGEMGLERA